MLVVGLGVMGSAVAHHLARRGARVIGIDRHRVPHDHGSSHGETRNFRQASYEGPAYVPLARRAFALWSELERESGRPLLRLTSRVMLGRPEHRSIRGALDAASRYGLEVETVTAAEVRRRWPAFTPADDMIGLVEHQAGMLFAEPCVEAQLDQARRHGAALSFDEQLLDWRPDGAGVAARTTAGRYQAGRLVLAVGAWLPELVPSLPLQIERQVLLWFEPRDGAADFAPDRFPAYFLGVSNELTVYGVPFWGDGLKVARHHGGELCTIDSVRRTVDEADVDLVRGVLQQYLPRAAGRYLRGKVCVYTNTPDQHFLIDGHPAHAAVYLVSPCSGHGFKYAPAIGEAVAQELIDGRSALDLSSFRLKRNS